MVGVALCLVVGPNEIPKIPGRWSIEGAAALSYSVIVSQYRETQSHLFSEEHWRFPPSRAVKVLSR